MSRVIVIGGGFAGLAAGVTLASKGVAVTLVERRKHLGGRARSFTDLETGDTVDNGQHLFMGCYVHTREFLKTIGTLQDLHFQDRFRIDFLHPRKGPTKLAFSRYLPPPTHVLAGFLGFSAVGFGDVLRLRRLKPHLEADANKGLTAAAWLDRCDQSAEIRRSFWTHLCLSALHKHPDEALAEHLIAVINQAILGPREGARLGYSGVGLSRLYTEAASSFIEQAGGRITLSAAAEQLQVSEDGVRLRISGNEVLRADSIVCATPPPALARILPDSCSALKSRLSLYSSSPILSVNLWFDRPITQMLFVALLESRMDWVFNKHIMYDGRDKASPGHIAMVASAAIQYIDMTDDALVDMAMEDLMSHFPDASSAKLNRSLVVRERQATYVLPVGQPRPGNRTVHQSVYVAGDWTETGLPPTIEAAVISGQTAASCCLDHLQGP